MRIAIALVVASVLAGCSHTGGTDGCVVFAPIYPTSADVDVISERLVDGVLGHNETYARVCGR